MRSALITLLAAAAFTAGFVIGGVLGYRLCNANWTAALEHLAGGL